jgi:hypothetical protein
VRRNFAEGGLRKWVSEKWVDIGAPKKDGKYQPCGRSKGSKRKYPKCVPLAKATQMTNKCCQKKAPSPEHWPCNVSNEKKMGGAIWVGIKGPGGVNQC